MLQSFQLFAKPLRTLLAPRSNPQMGSHPHHSNKKDIGKCQSLFYWAGKGVLLEHLSKFFNVVKTEEYQEVEYKLQKLVA